MTKKEMYQVIIDLANGKEVDVEMGVIAEFCENEINILDRKAIKAKERAEAKKNEDVLYDSVKGVLTDELQTIPEITTVLSETIKDITVGKVQYRLRMLIDNGEAKKGEVVVPATEMSPKRTIMGYALV